MTTAIIGIGLIGSSFALKLRKEGLCDTLIGVDNNERNLLAAAKLNYYDELLPLEEAVAKADLIVLATPVNVIPQLCAQILDSITPHQIVMDMGSIKNDLCEAVAEHPNRGRFVATHPMWGTEHSGPKAATADSFSRKSVVVCEKERSDSDALQTVETIYRSIGMKIKYMTPSQHDLHTAYISHISHITSFALALTVLEKERETEAIFDLASGGFESTVRLAKSAPKTWTPIIMKNRYNILEVLNENIHQLMVFKRILEKENEKELNEMIKKANQIKKILN